MLLLKYFILVIILTCCGSAQSLKWYKPAVGFAKAEAETKYLLLDAYTDWCIWCRVMDTATYAKPEVIVELEKNFIPVKYNPEKDGDIIIAGRRYTPESFVSTFRVTGYPATLFFSHDGKFIQTITGYLEAEEFLSGVVPFILGGDAGKMNYQTAKYLKILDSAAQMGVTGSLQIAYSIVFLEIEGNGEKALEKLNGITTGDPDYELAQSLIRYITNPEKNTPSEEVNLQLQKIIEIYLK